MLGRLAAAVSLVVGLATVPAYGAPAAQCEMLLGSVTPGGDHVQQKLTATSAGPKEVLAADRFADGVTRLHSSWILEPEVPGYLAHYGHVVLGSALYRVFYRTPQAEPTSFTRIGGGWDGFTFFEESYYDEGSKPNPLWHRMVVRASTWQGFETLVASRCGQSGFLLLGIDKDTSCGQLYAVGHANGTATAIQSLGKVPTTFNDPTYFAWGTIAWAGPPIFGE